MPCGGNFPRRPHAGSLITFCSRGDAAARLDLAGFNRLADELEDEAILAAGKRPGVVIVPDVNLLFYAVVSAFPQHEAAHAWWEETINSPRRSASPPRPSSGSSG